VEENLKGRLVLVLGILNVIFLLFWVSSCNDVRKFKKAREKEMDTRLAVEQDRDKLSKLESSLKEKLGQVQEELGEKKAALDAVKKSLSQEQMVSNSLKSELEKISRLKEALEEDLKDALVRGKISSRETSKK